MRSSTFAISGALSALRSSRMYFVDPGKSIYGIHLIHDAENDPLDSVKSFSFSSIKPTACKS
jgi:hypothetical protein